MCKTVRIEQTLLFPGKLVILFQTIRHKDSFEILVVPFRVIAVSGFPVFIHNNLRNRAQFSGKMYPHVTLVACRSAIVDYFQRRLVTLIYMCLQLGKRCPLIEYKDTISQLNMTIKSQNEIIPHSDEQKHCSDCGVELEGISKQFVRREFRFTPAKGEVVNIYVETAKCPVYSEALVMAESIQLVKAHAPEVLMPHSYVTASVAV